MVSFTPERSSRLWENQIAKFSDGPTNNFHITFNFHTSVNLNPPASLSDNLNCHLERAFNTNPIDHGVSTRVCGRVRIHAPGACSLTFFSCVFAGYRYGLLLKKYDFLRDIEILGNLHFYNF